VFGIEQTPPRRGGLMHCKGLALPKPCRFGSYGPYAHAVAAEPRWPFLAPVCGMSNHETKHEEFERRALECTELSKQSTEPKTREHFAALAEAWVQLAKKLTTRVDDISE
jgi:hypothetical protein